MHIVFVLAHFYLMGVALWYVVIVTRYGAEDPIPQYVRESFEKDDGEAACFSFSALAMFIGIGFFIEAIYLWNAHPVNLALILLIFLGIVFALISHFFFHGWQKTIE